MSAKPSPVRPLVGASIAAGLFLLWRAEREPARPEVPPALPAASGRPTVAGTAAAAAHPARPDARSSLAGHPVMQSLQQTLDRPGVRSHEALLTFANAEAYRKFLARARQSGLTVLGQLDALLAVRVRYDSLADLQADLLGNAADFSEVGANFYISIPQAPEKEDRALVNLVPLGDKLRQFLGVTGDCSQWGRGVTIAVLDSGVAPDGTFGLGRVQYLDVGLGAAAGTGAEDGHGTAVAALAAGMSPDAPGVAPAAGILSIRITDAGAQSDVFTLSEAIIAAVDAGVQIVNISLGGYETNDLLTNAIELCGPARGRHRGLGRQRPGRPTHLAGGRSAGGVGGRR